MTKHKHTFINFDWAQKHLLRQKANCKSLLLLCLFLCSMPLHARHVRAYCFMSCDSSSIFEDSCIKLSLDFDQNTGHAVANIINKTDSTIYLRSYACTASTNGHADRLAELGDASSYSIAPGASKRIHGWSLLSKKLNESVVETGKCRNCFQWEPGRKGRFINQADGSKKRFKKGMCMGYTPQTTPLCLTVHVVYATSKSMNQLNTAEVCLYVSDIAIGRRNKDIKEDAYIPSKFNDRPYFYFDSGGCDALPYAGGVITMSVGYAAAGVAVLGYLWIKVKVDAEEEDDY